MANLQQIGEILCILTDAEIVALNAIIGGNCGLVVSKIPPGQYPKGTAQTSGTGDCLPGYHKNAKGDCVADQIPPDPTHP